MGERGGEAVVAESNPENRDYGFEGELWEVKKPWVRGKGGSSVFVCWQFARRPTFELLSRHQCPNDFVGISDEYSGRSCIRRWKMSFSIEGKKRKEKKKCEKRKKCSCFRT